jgi:transcriptional regulator GlxA family with amidase domain
MNEITLPMLAAMHGVTPGHLSRTFKRETGYGISEYLTLVRLRKAEFMLKNEPGKSVNEVAFACGFNDSNYFSFKFKKAYGVPPLKVKNKKV